MQCVGYSDMVKCYSYTLITRLHIYLVFLCCMYSQVHGHRTGVEVGGGGETEYPGLKEGEGPMKIQIFNFFYPK